MPAPAPLARKARGTPARAWPQGPLVWEPNAFPPLKGSAEPVTSGAAGGDGPTVHVNQPTASGQPAAASSAPAARGSSASGVDRPTANATTAHGGGACGVGTHGAGWRESGMNSMDGRWSKAEGRRPKVKRRVAKGQFGVSWRKQWLGSNTAPHPGGQGLANQQGDPQLWTCEGTAADGWLAACEECPPALTMVLPLAAVHPLVVAHSWLPLLVPSNRWFSSRALPPGVEMDMASFVFKLSEEDIDEAPGDFAAGDCATQGSNAELTREEEGECEGAREKEHSLQVGRPVDLPELPVRYTKRTHMREAPGAGSLANALCLERVKSGMPRRRSPHGPLARAMPLGGLNASARAPRCAD
uniref:Uncharacterized protein n=1 Tax=Alexandrium monilatum TaxID=311494 RepID=A0A7S4PRV4_9DINO